MNLYNHYWYFKSVIPPKLCDDIIKYGLSHSETMGITGGYDENKLTKDQLKDMKKKRNSMAGWNFEWNRTESIQFTKYKLNQYYDWHCDSWDRPYQKKEGDPDNGKIRKLSMTCQLTDGSEYKGGELEFDFRNNDPDKKSNIHKCTEILSKGSIVVFPSFVWHRVKPVTKGKRYSLVMWNLGYPFK